MVLNIIISIVGFAVLLKCADFFVDGASSLAKNFKVPSIVIGLTIVAFGTSAPEFAVSFSSHAAGNSDMMFGNAIGSNIVNTLFIIGLSVVLVPFNIQSDLLKKQLPLLLLITLAFSALFIGNFAIGGEKEYSLSRTDGIVLILLFSVFVYYLISLIFKSPAGTADDEKPKYKLLKAIIMTLLGLAGIILGSKLVVDNVAEFADRVGISQKIISVTIIAIGTSLPELVTTITAILKGERDIAVGNIIGSNIFNICIVLGLPVIIFGDAVTVSFNYMDLVFLIASVVLLWIFSATSRKLKRYEGVTMILAYFVYGAFILGPF